jgi:holo-ACP synthase/triphosphoribosyl-dephospho-CoA synthase
VFRELLSKGADRNQAGAGAFIALVARGTDTNMIRRGGPAIAEKAAERAAELFRRDELPDMQLIEELDKQFIEQNLSPGGCADLLAITYFLNDYCG